MSNIKITQEKIDRMMKEAKTAVFTAFGKCTVVAMQFENGFILTASSACVDPANYDLAMGVKYAKAQIEHQLWQLEGYALQKAVHRIATEE